MKYLSFSDNNRLAKVLFFWQLAKVSAFFLPAKRDGSLYRRAREARVPFQISSACTPPQRGREAVFLALRRYRAGIVTLPRWRRSATGVALKRYLIGTKVVGGRLKTGTTKTPQGGNRAFLSGKKNIRFRPAVQIWQNPQSTLRAIKTRHCAAYGGMG